jgi:hypothetical protein
LINEVPPSPQPTNTAMSWPTWKSNIAVADPWCLTGVWIWVSRNPVSAEFGYSPG